MALPNRRTPMRVSVRPTVGCGPSAPAPGRIRGSPPAPGRIRDGQSSNWRPLQSCGNGSVERLRPLCQIGFGQVRKYLVRYFRTGTKPIWQSGLSRSTYPFPHLRWTCQNWLSRWDLLSFNTNGHGLQASHERSNNRIGDCRCGNERRHLLISCKIQKPVTQ